LHFDVIDGVHFVVVVVVVVAVVVLLLSHGLHFVGHALDRISLSSS
jgi:hypothetical protein